MSDQKLGDPGQVRIHVDRLHEMAEGDERWQTTLTSAATQVEQIVAHWRAAGISDLVIGAVVNTVIRAQVAAQDFGWATGEDAAIVLTLDALERQAPPVSLDELEDFLT